MNLFTPVFRLSCCRLRDARSLRSCSHSQDDGHALFYKLNYGEEGEVSSVTKFMPAQPGYGRPC